jgi:hypothetical protein
LKEEVEMSDLITVPSASAPDLNYH